MGIPIFTFEVWADGDPLDAALVDLPLSRRTRSRLVEPRWWAFLLRQRRVPAVPRTVRDLVAIPARDLLTISGFGRTCLAEVEAWLRLHGLFLRECPRRQAEREINGILDMLAGEGSAVLTSIQVDHLVRRLMEQTKDPTRPSRGRFRFGAAELEVLVAVAGIRVDGPDVAIGVTFDNQERP